VQRSAQMKEQILALIDETVTLLRRCERPQEWVDRYIDVRRRFQADPTDARAIEDLYVLSAPRGFLGDCPHTPKTDSGLSNTEIEAMTIRLVEKTWDAIEQWKAQHSRLKGRRPRGGAIAAHHRGRRKE
jgi:hypothetical protein